MELRESRVGEVVLEKWVVRLGCGDTRGMFLYGGTHNRAARLDRAGFG